jgi:hypothetical protein
MLVLLFVGLEKHTSRNLLLKTGIVLNFCQGRYTSFHPENTLLGCRAVCARIAAAAT